MRTLTLYRLCAAAVAMAFALPAVAQQSPTIERDADAAQPGVRQGDAQPGEVRQGTTLQPGQQPGQTLPPGRTVRPGAPPAGVIVEEERIEGRTTQPGTRTANFPPGQRQGRGQIDNRSLARFIAAENEALVRVSEFARQQAQSDEVKQFAEEMVQAHTKFSEQLSQAAGSSPEAGERPRTGRRSTTTEERTTRQNIQGEEPRDRDPADPNQPREEAADPNQPRDNAQGARERLREGAREVGAQVREGAQGLRDQVSGQESDRDRSAVRERQTDTDRATTRTQTETETRTSGRNRAEMRGGNPILALHEQIKEQCAQSAIAALREKQGEEFDHAFMHLQVMAHMGMLDTLKIAQPQATGELQQVLQQGQQTTQQHLDEAKQLLAQLDSQRAQP